MAERAEDYLARRKYLEMAELVDRGELHQAFDWKLPGGVAPGKQDAVAEARSRADRLKDQITTTIQTTFTH